MVNRRIGIIGAGTTGVYLAGLLTKQGCQVALFEKAPSPRTEGCGIFLIRAGMEALDQGNPQICQQLIEAGDPVQNFEFRNLRGGMISAEAVPEQENQLPGMLIHRKEILSALLEALPPECLHCNTELEALDQNEEGVIAHFRDGSEWVGDLLVGADGIVSKVRPYVVPGVGLHYLGDLVWRGVVSDRSFCSPGHFIVYARGRGVYANFFQIGGDRTHWGFFVEVEQEQPGILCPSNTAMPTLELAKLPADARAVIAATPPEQVVCRYSYDIEPLPQLYQGRVVLIGDAAHAKSPARARGMCSGFEDALSLARHLAAGTDISTVLKQFEAERLPIVHEYQRTSRHQSQRIGRRQQKGAA